MTVTGCRPCARSSTRSTSRPTCWWAVSWRPAAGGRRLDVHDPSTGTVLATVADADPGDAAAAVDAAAAAAAGWAATSPR